jgi:hypothetical protein
VLITFFGKLRFFTAAKKLKISGFENLKIAGVRKICVGGIIFFDFVVVEALLLLGCGNLFANPPTLQRHLGRGDSRLRGNER